MLALVGTFSWGVCRSGVGCNVVVDHLQGEILKRGQDLAFEIFQLGTVANNSACSLMSTCGGPFAGEGLWISGGKHHTNTGKLYLNLYVTGITLNKSKRSFCFENSLCAISLAEGLERSSDTRHCCYSGSLQDGDKQELSDTSGILHAEGVKEKQTDAAVRSAV